MAYHEGYWVALATAAPVIGLAHVLVFNRYESLLSASRRARRRLRGDYDRRQDLALITWSIRSIYSSAAVGFVTCFLGLLTALVSLANGSNAAGTVTMTVDIMIAAGLLLVEALSDHALQGLVRAIEPID